MIRHWNHKAKIGVRNMSLGDRLAVVVLLVVAMLVGGMHLNRPAFSLFDEVTFLGYVQFVTDGHVARSGDLLPSWPREYVACLPVPPHGLVTDVPCGEVVDDPGRYPFGGTRVGQGWPPVYFALAAPPAVVADAVGWNVLTAARLASLLLFALGSLLVFSAARVFGAPASTSLGAAVLLWALISGDLYSRFVTPHSMVPLLMGSTLLVVAWRAKRSSGFGQTVVLLALLMLLTALSVPHAVLPVGTAIVALAAWEALRAPRGLRSLTRTASLALVVLSGVIAYGTWRVIQSRLVGPRLDVIAPPFEEATVQGIGLTTRFANYALYYWPGAIVGDTHIAPASRVLIGGVVAVAVLLAVGAILLRGRGITIERLLSIGFFGGLIATGIVFSYMLAAAPMRYAYGFAVLGLVLLAIGMRHSRLASYLLPGLATVAMIVALLKPAPPL
jgi:hypothetical protein